MLLTEEEAKKKWCPLDTVPESVPYCTASGCMAWRWKETIDLNKGAKIKKGYCGLAGRVE